MSPSNLGDVIIFLINWPFRKAFIKGCLIHVTSWAHWVLVQKPSVRDVKRQRNGVEPSGPQSDLKRLFPSKIVFSASVGTMNPKTGSVVRFCHFWNFNRTSIFFVRSRSVLLLSLVIVSLVEVTEQGLMKCLLSLFGYVGVMRSALPSGWVTILTSWSRNFVSSPAWYLIG